MGQSEKAPEHIRQTVAQLMKEGEKAAIKPDGIVIDLHGVGWVDPAARVALERKSLDWAEKYADQSIVITRASKGFHADISCLMAVDPPGHFWIPKPTPRMADGSDWFRILKFTWKDANPET